MPHLAYAFSRHASRIGFLAPWLAVLSLSCSSDEGSDPGGSGGVTGGTVGSGGASGGNSSGGNSSGGQGQSPSGGTTSGGASTGGGTGGIASGGAESAGGGMSGGAASGGSNGSGGGPSASPVCRSFSNGSGTTHPCYIGSDQTAYCINEDGSTTALSGATPAINTSGQGFTTGACVVTQAGAAHCGMYASLSEWIASGVTQVSGMQDGQCALVGTSVQCSTGDPTVPGAVEQIACFYKGCCAINDSGELHCWGTHPALSNTDVQKMPLPAGKKALQSGPGQEAMCVVLEGGQVHCWGRDWNGQLSGLGETDATGVTLVDSGALAVVGGQFHTCVLFTDGTVQCTGGNTAAGAGLDVMTLTAVPGIDSAVALSAGKHYTCALLADASIQCWGALGGGGTTPTAITGPAAASCE